MSTEFPTRRERRAARETQALAEQTQTTPGIVEGQRVAWDSIVREQLAQEEAARQRTRQFFNEQITRDLINKQPPEWVEDTDAGIRGAQGEKHVNPDNDEEVVGDADTRVDETPSTWFSNQPAEWFAKQFISEFRERAGIVDDDCTEADDEASERGHREAVERIEKAAGKRVDLVGEWLGSEAVLVEGETDQQPEQTRGRADGWDHSEKTAAADDESLADQCKSDAHKHVNTETSRQSKGQPREWFRRQSQVRTAPPRNAHHRHEAPSAGGVHHRYRRVIIFASVLSVALLGSAALILMPGLLAKPGSVIYADQLLSQANLPNSPKSPALVESQPSQTAPAQSVTVGSEATSAPVAQESFTSTIPVQNITPQNAPTPGEISPTFTSTGHANIDWAALVLTDAGLPVTTNNVTSILQWMDSENDPQSWYLRNNPLNNGLGSGGGSGLGSYDNLSIAAVYVAQQLQRDLFSGITAALKANSDPSVTAQAIVTSAWAAGHYNWGDNWHAVDVPVVTAPTSAW